MNVDRTKRIRRQPNGLIEPHTVMIGERPVVVPASSVEEAVRLAKAKVASEVAEQNKTKPAEEPEVGDER